MAPSVFGVIVLAADHFEPPGQSDADGRIKVDKLAAGAAGTGPNGRLRAVLLGRISPDVAALDALEERLRVKLAIVRRRDRIVKETSAAARSRS